MIWIRAFRAVGILAFSLPVFSQYAGPAILSRGEAPTPLANAQISFRPYLEIAGIYDTGLIGLIINEQGGPPVTTAYGIEFIGGVSGAHSWRHTKVGLDYQFSARHYDKATYYDGINQSLLLGISHQFTRHTMLTLRENAGEFAGNYGFPGLSSTVPFDPATSFVPTTDFFDNRVLYASTQADFTIQKSARLSFDLGGDGFLARRRSSALYGVTGASGRADMQYRISRHTTLGVGYIYEKFDFTRIFSGTDMHSVVGTYAKTLTPHLEVTGYAGILRYETKFIQSVPVDPAIVALFGITTGPEVSYHVGYTPNINVRLARTFRQGVAYVSGGHSIVPGNGLFLTSTMTTLIGGYSYTGLRRWSMDANVAYSDATSQGGLLGHYADLAETVSLSRQINRRGLHAIASFSAHKYISSDYSAYNQVFYLVRIGIGWAPGDVPLRVW